MDVPASAIDDKLLVEVYVSTREDRLAMDKQAAKLKEKEEEYKTELIARMHKTGTGAMASASHITKLSKKEVPHAKNWDLIHQYIVANGAWEILQNRLTTSAIAERWDAGEAVPGVEAFPVYNVTISKL